MRRTTPCAAAIFAAVLFFSTALHAAQLVASQLVTAGLTSPVFLTHAPNDYSRVFVLEQIGRVRIIQNGQLLPTPFLNIWTLISSSGEGGLLGLAFHPNFQSNGYLYVRYNDTVGRTTVARYTISSTNPNIAVPSSAQIVLRMSQPSLVHTGGSIEFGPDGFLYIAQGDADVSENAQIITNNWFGKILRIDVNTDAFPADPLRNYAIPPTNPFVGVTGDDEIWAYGLRNPYRMSFDRHTGDLWIADVGAASWEEMDFQPAGATGAINYGWPCMEGAHCVARLACPCPMPGSKAPIWEYSHASGCAIIGGRMYRGCAIPELRGAYLCADFCSAKIWSFHYDGSTISQFQQIQSTLDPPGPATISAISAIGEDTRGELYLCELGGSIYKIVPFLAPIDRDGDGVPDSCQVFDPADLNRDGIVDGFDLVSLLGVWGTCASCSADLNHDGSVNGLDLASMLGDWG